MDYTKDTYTIKSIDQSTGNVKVVFDCDGKEQTLGGAPLDDADQLKSFLTTYLSAYKQGKKTEEVKVDSSVSDLVGKKQTADTEA